MSVMIYDEREIDELVSIVDVLRWGLSKARSQPLYYGHGTDNAWDDIRALILGCLHLPWDVEPTLLLGRLSHAEKKHLALQLGRRLNERVPVPYLTHEAYFCGLSFYVDERVLIPRSPLAELIERQFSPWVMTSQVDRILDLCTGSACIAIACCYAFPDAYVDAVDIDSDALIVARMNQERHHLEDQLTLIQSDCFSELDPVRYDIIVSNPPYVSAEEMRSLPKEYQHEPVLALEAADNGLEIVHNILAHAAQYLTDDGILIVEVGNSADALIAAYPELPFTWLEFERGGQGVFMLPRSSLGNK